MTDSREVGLDAWRDRQVADDPSSPVHKTRKGDVRNYVNAAADERDAILERLGDVEAVNSGQHLGYATWSDLSAVTPAGGAGSIAEVFPSDSGTHTDPVVGGVVANSGVYIYSASPAGWKRVYDYPTRSTPGVIQLAFIEAPTASILRLKIAQPNIPYPSGMVGTTMQLPRMPIDKPFGSPSYDLYEYYAGSGEPPPGTVQILNDAPIFDFDGTAAAEAGVWLKDDAPQLRREASGLTYFVRQPAPEVEALQEGMQNYLLQTPSLNEPVAIQRMARRVLVARHMSIAYDDPDLRMDQDYATTVLYDMARAQSYGAPKLALLWAVNSQWAEIHGSLRSAGRYLSNEMNGGNFDREGHTTTESVIRVGELATADTVNSLVGAGHGGLANEAGEATEKVFNNVTFNGGGTTAIVVGDTVTGLTSGATGVVYKVDETQASGMGWALGNQTGTLHLKDRGLAFIIGEPLQVGGVTKAYATSTGIETGSALDLPINGVLNCAEWQLRQPAGMYYDHDDLESWFGERVDNHKVNVDGVTFEPQFLVGRRLKFENGETEIEAGQVVTGDTSGATGTVVVVPDRTAEGTWAGGDRSGSIFLEAVTGAFEVGEGLEVGASKVAEVAALLGPAIGVLNSYGPLAKLTNVNMAKIPYYNAIRIGYANGVQRPDASDNYGAFTFAGTWPVAALDPADYSPIQFWHSADAVTDRTPILDLHFDSPMDPPGDFSLATTSQISIEDRHGGNRTALVNFVSGATPTEFEGVWSTSYRHQFRLGNPI